MWKFLNVFKLKTISVPARNIHKYTFKMNKAYLRHASDSNYFQITFHYKNLDLKVDRQFNFQRQLNETVGTFIGRVETNLEKATAKKKKGKAKAVVVEKYLEAKNVKGNNEEAVKEGYGNETNKVQKMNENEQNSFLILFYVNGKPIEDTLICSELFKEDKEVTFKINESEYKVIINSPWIETISLPTSILANFPVYPVKYESVNAEQSLSDFIWFKSNDKKTWSEIGKGFIHVTNNEDINNYLKLIAIPKNEKFEGPRVECESSVKVEASPGECPFEKRHKFCQNHLTQAEFRVVSYNILADLYCDSDFTRTVLFPYCPAYALGIDYRKQLILKELIGYNSDLICLQEVDKKVFVYDLNPVLSNYGYESIFNLKGGLVAEGLACFFRTDRFVLLESNSFELSKELYRNSIYKDIWDAVSKNMKLRDRLIDRTSALQCVVLQSKDIEGEILVVANTHLYFHPDADHIRLLQGGICIRFIQHLVDDLKNRFKEKRISTIFCGDFNSSPDCGIYRLYTTGSVPNDIPDWKSNESEAINDLSLTQTLRLQSACGTPKYTNYTAGFKDCLDYIYYSSDNLKVSQVVPLPSDEELSANCALPSIVFPSDHVALISDFKWL